MALSMSKLPTRIACNATMPPSEITAVSVVPPPTSTTMLPSGSWIGRLAPMAAAIGCSIKYAPAAPARRAASSTARFSTSVMADGTQINTRGRLNRVTPVRCEQQADHPLRDLEVGDRALAQWPHRDDVAGRPPDHLPGLVTHGQDVLAPTVEGDNGWFVEDDA